MLTISPVFDPIIRSSVNLDCFISVSLKVTDSTHFWRKFRGSGHFIKYDNELYVGDEIDKLPV